MDLSEEKNPFHPAFTDAGLCSVHNGDALASTFKSTGEPKIAELGQLLDTRDDFAPEKISGTGYSHEKSFWFDLEDK